MLEVENRPILWALALSLALHAAVAVVAFQGFKHNGESRKGPLEVALLESRPEAAAAATGKTQPKADVDAPSASQEERAREKPGGQQVNRSDPDKPGAGPAARARLAPASHVSQCDACQVGLSPRTNAPHRGPQARDNGATSRGQAKFGGTSAPVSPTVPGGEKPSAKQAPASSRGLSTTISKVSLARGRGKPFSPASRGRDLRPLCLSCPAPVYPLSARREGWQGDVEVALKIAGDGSVRAARVGRSSGYAALDLAAIKVARRSRFALPRGSGERAGRMIYRFVLEDD